MVLKLLFYKLFGLEEPPCPMCELLKSQLATSEFERKELLGRLLDKDKEVAVPLNTSELKPVIPQILPWSVRKQMLEKEDREAARIMREKEKELTETLEKELGVEDAK